MSEPLEEGRSETISYERLYRLWEENNWSATGIDFSLDREHWWGRLTERQREAALWNYAMFLVGEEAVARTLTPVLDAAPTYEQSIFLTTQVVDEARHHVFFDRFMREVADQGMDTESTLLAMGPHLTWGFRGVFEELDNLTDALRKKPRDRALLAQSVALYHLVVEGLLAIPGQHFIKRYVEKLDILPGFSAGMRNVARDESRHVAFGVKFLGDLFEMDKECRPAAIELWDRVLPYAVGVFVPPNRDRSFATCFDFTLEEIYAFGLRSFEMKLKRIGVEPNEITILDRQDTSQSYEERARKAWVLIDQGVLGDDSREPELNDEGFEIMFEAMIRALNIEVARTLDGPLQWQFSDASPWHIVVTDGHAEAKPGAVANPALTFEVESGEWAKIAVGRSDPRWALLKRKLKVQGSLSNKARLAKLFN